MTKIVVACIIHFGTYGKRYVTGELVADLHEVLIVDISHAMESLNIDDQDYHKYVIPREECEIGKSSSKAAQDSNYKIRAAGLP